MGRDGDTQTDRRGFRRINIFDAIGARPKSVGSLLLSSWVAGTLPLSKAAALGIDNRYRWKLIPIPLYLRPGGRASRSATSGRSPAQRNLRCPSASTMRLSTLTVQRDRLHRRVLSLAPIDVLQGRHIASRFNGPQPHAPFSLRTNSPQADRAPNESTASRYAVVANRLFVFLFVLFVFGDVANAAYIDPGTGSMVLQAAIAGIAAAALAIKTYWHRIKLFFSKDSSSDTEDS